MLNVGAQVSNVEGLEPMEGVVIPKAQPIQSFTQALSSYPQVKFVTSAGEFVVELYPDKTPKTVENFLGYVRDGHYNSTLFHRVINNFMIQGGGYDTKYNENTPAHQLNTKASKPRLTELFATPLARFLWPALTTHTQPHLSFSLM